MITKPLDATACALIAALALLSGCQCGTELELDAGPDSGAPRDSGVPIDAGADAGDDAGFDAGTMNDGGSDFDSGTDAGLDAGSLTDGGSFDAGPLTCAGATTFGLVQFFEAELDAHPAGCLAQGHFYFESADFSTDPLLVTAFATCAAGGPFGNCCFTPAMGCFYSPDAGQICSGFDAGVPPMCMPIIDGGMVVGLNCPDAGAPPPPPVYLNAGTVTLSKGSAVFATIPFASSPYQWLVGDPFHAVTPSPFPAGAMLGVAANGGPDVAAFDSSVIAVSTVSGFSPSTCTGTPPVVSRSQDAHFTWQPDPLGGAQAYLTFSASAIGTGTPGGTLTCWAPDDSGQLTIPAAALQLIPSTPILPAALIRVRSHLACPGAEGGTVASGLSVTVESHTATSGIINLQ